MKEFEEQSGGTPVGDSMGIICCGGRHFDCYPFLNMSLTALLKNTVR